LKKEIGFCGKIPEIVDEQRFSVIWLKREFNMSFEEQKRGTVDITKLK